MSQQRDAWKRVRQAKATSFARKAESHVVIAIIRLQRAGNLEEVSCVPRGRLNVRDGMQKFCKIYWGWAVTPQRRFWV